MTKPYRSTYYACCEHCAQGQLVHTVETNKPIGPCPDRCNDKPAQQPAVTAQ